MDEEFIGEEENDEDKDLGTVKKEKSNGLVDLEDLGKVVTKQKRSKVTKILYQNSSFLIYFCIFFCNTSTSFLF